MNIPNLCSATDVCENLCHIKLQCTRRSKQSGWLVRKQTSSYIYKCVLYMVNTASLCWHGLCPDASVVLLTLHYWNVICTMNAICACMFCMVWSLKKNVLCYKMPSCNNPAMCELSSRLGWQPYRMLASVLCAIVLGYGCCTVHPVNLFQKLGCPMSIIIIITRSNFSSAAIWISVLATLMV